MKLARDRPTRYCLLRHATFYVASGLALTLPACNRDHPREPPATKIDTVSVKVAHVERLRRPGFQPVTGTVRPLARALIATRIMGTVQDANFAVGQAVSAGDILLKIQAGELTARLERARAALNQATRDFGRETALLAQGSSTQEVVRTAEDQLHVARAAFEEAEILLSYSQITAPFPGFVTRKLINTGDFTVPGTPLLELEARDRMRAELDVPDTLGLLAVGVAVPVVSSSGTISGRISEVSPAADSATRTRRVIVDLPSQAVVYSGEFVRALWPTAESEILFVPAQAVSYFGQIERVFVVEQGRRAELRFVKTGATELDRVQILSGLTAGETVVVAPPSSLRDGHPVQVQP